jgi:hypothetical protein
LTAFVASLALAAPHRAGADFASNANQAFQNSITEIQVCEAMGGKAEVHQTMAANGAYIVDVTCKGGAMDGFHCVNDNYGTDCHFDRIILPPKSRISEVEAVEIAPLVASTPDTGAAGEQMDNIAPADQGTTNGSGTLDVTPTPETGADSGTAPVVSDPVDSDGDGSVSAEPTATPDVGQIDVVDVSIPVVPVDESVAPATDDQIPVKQLDPIDIDGIRFR